MPVSKKFESEKDVREQIINDAIKSSLKRFDGLYEKLAK